MPEKNIKTFIYPIVALAIFTLLIFGAGYAYFVGSTSMNAANYQVTLPKVTTLTCSKTDCNVTLTPQMMYNTNVNATVAKGTSTCYLNCTCSGTQNAVCTYNVRFLEMGQVYTPSASLGSGKEFTAKVTSPSGCSAQNSSSTETQVNTIRDKVVSSCSLTVPASGTATANIAAEFKWYNLNLDQSAQANARFMYQLTNDNQQYTVTLDPNGGSVSQSTIQVTYGEPYGQIPTPTWSGHTFRGWNGKNLLNLSKYATNNSTCVINDNSITVYKGTAQCATGNFSLTNGNTYHVSADIKGSFDNRIYGFWGYSVYYSGVVNNHISYSFTRSSDDKSGFNLYQSNSNSSVVTTLLTNSLIFTNIMVEEGSTESLYEPYFITSTTKVVQNQNHTLTAIWD